MRGEGKNRNSSLHLPFRQIAYSTSPALQRRPQTTHHLTQPSHALQMTSALQSTESPSNPSPTSISTTTPSTPPHDPLDKSTFLPPNFHHSLNSPPEELPRIVIEFCDRCRWLFRATWTLTELFLTFPPISIDVEVDALEGREGGKVERKESGLKAISLLPRSAPETGGRFRVWLYRQSDGREEEFASWGGAELVWDRKLEGGFPEMKELVRCFFFSSRFNHRGGMLGLRRP